MDRYLCFTSNGSNPKVTPPSIHMGIWDLPTITNISPCPSSHYYFHSRKLRYWRGRYANIGFWNLRFPSSRNRESPFLAYSISKRTQSRLPVFSIPGLSQPQDRNPNPRHFSTSGVLASPSLVVYGRHPWGHSYSVQLCQCRVVTLRRPAIVPNSVDLPGRTAVTLSSGAGCCTSGPIPGRSPLSVCVSPCCNSIPIPTANSIPPRVPLVACPSSGSCFFSTAHASSCRFIASFIATNWFIGTPH
ncbi:hypothetical protein F5Y01DRAFT_23878 [Xylaria sp. FL0043]|nr:hypothetical protein F5Y01DRAFT_23878 [Xylaria sp. FL0043]